MFITDGMIEITVNNKAIIAQKGDVIFLSTHETHYTKVLKTPYKRYVLMLAPAVLETKITDLNLLSVFKKRTSDFQFCLRFNDQNIIKTFVELIIKEIQNKQDEYSEKIQVTLIEYLLIIALRKQNNDMTYSSEDDIDTLANNDYANPTKVSENIEIANCILSTNCRAFMIGGHGTADDNPHNKIQNINIHDIEIINIANNLFIDDKVHSRYWSGIFRILSQSGQHIENIRFENINVNWTKGYNGKAFHIEIRSDETASYTEKAGYRINDVKFKNICFYHCPYNIEKALIENGITGDENARIENISFENVKYENAASFDLYEVNGESENIEITF